MFDLKLGDFFTFKNHPFQIAETGILIGADPSFTPPIMVVCEILNSGNLHNTDDGIKDPNQIKGLFYSHKTHKYEKHWFKVDEIKILENLSPAGKKINTEAVTLQTLKSTIRNNEVILNSVNLELGKNKISQEQRTFENVILKRNPYLDFVPPVMIVIDIRLHETIKDNFHKTSGKEKRKHSKFELKCKYFNPSLTTFSEEWLPIDCVVNITSNFSLDSVSHLIDKHIVYPLVTPINFEESQFRQINTIVKIKEIVFYHYKYLLLTEDICTNQIIKIDIEKASTLKSVELEELFQNRLPNSSTNYSLPQSAFIKANLYEISYLSDKGIPTKRIIYVKDKFKIEEDKDSLIVANCFLRKGHLRNFKLSNIKNSRRIKRDKKDLFIEKKLFIKVAENIKPKS